MAPDNNSDADAGTVPAISPTVSDSSLDSAAAKADGKSASGTKVLVDGIDINKAKMHIASAESIVEQHTHVIIDRNSVVNGLAWAVALTLAFKYHWSGIFFYPTFLFVADVLYYKYAVCVFDPELSIARGYQISAYCNDTLHSVGVDYGFNFYDGDYKKSRRQAQVDKFEYAYEQLKLKPGMSLIDVGCGCGDWIHWLQTEKDIRVMGVNITYTQVNECRKRGLNVICSNWKDLDLEKEGLVGKFDAVTFWDTVEHYVNMKDRHNYPVQNEVYTKMFDMAHRFMKKDTSSGRIFISCLHMRRGFTTLKMSRDKLYKMYYCYLLDKMHSGFYPSYGGNPPDQLVLNAKKHFGVVHRKDTTMDYYMTSMLEPTHFGVHKFAITPFRVAYLSAQIVLDPHWLQKFLWYYASNWMLQFDGDDIDKSDMILWWLVFERN